jgi:Zn-dependent alcohol dehydrogenase
MPSNATKSTVREFVSRRCLCGIPKLFIPKLLDLYSQGRFPFDRLVKFYDFNLFNEAVADSESGRVIKAIIRMSQV